MMRNTRLLLLACAALAAIAGCSGGGSPGAPPPSPAPPPPPPPPPSGSVVISGAITYDFVPFNPATNGLNYNATTQRPAPVVVVEATTAAGSVIASGVTTAAGAYSLTVPAGTAVRIQARARTIATTPGQWDFTVRDNTSGNAPYVLTGALIDSGSANSTRNLNAPSGWGGSSYTTTRAAGPFAIVDSIYTALTAVSGIAPGTNFQPAQVFWSINNRAADGSIANGEIGSTSFTFISGVPTILVQGSADNDTDEYDRHVIAHEFGHYVEDTLSRNDSIGGSHSLSQRLDPRLSFSEGWSNAFSGIVLDDPVYRDSSGAGQSTGFSINVENNVYASTGWFGEGSVQSIVYDVFDTANDGADAISAGFGPVLRARLSPTFMANSTAPTTIFSYIEALKAEAGVGAAAVDALRLAQNINGVGVDGAGETNDGAIVSSLPVFRTLAIGAPAIVICSVNDAGTINKLGNRTLLRLPVPAPQSVTLTMTRVSGATARDPDFIVSLRGNRVATAFSNPAETEVLTTSLSASDHVVDAYDFLNIDDDGPSGDACYNFQAN